jgi:hypothetical protein
VRCCRTTGTPSSEPRREAGSRRICGSAAPAKTTTKASAGPWTDSRECRRSSAAKGSPPPSSIASKWKAAVPGRKAIGYMPVYVPREIVHAADVPIGDARLDDVFPKEKTVPDSGATQ